MPPEVRDPADPQEWLRRARSNLARARAGQVAPEVAVEDLCFDAQQAAEKEIKAFLVARGIRFPKTHSLADLVTRLRDSGVLVPDAVAESVVLTPYAVEFRYPGPTEPLTDEEYASAVQLAEVVVRWVEGSLPEPAPPEPDGE